MNTHTYTPSLPRTLQGFYCYNFPLMNITGWVCACYHSISAPLNKVPCLMLTLTLHSSCLDMVRLSTCFDKEFTCMLSTDLSTKATQPFFIYPCEIPPEDSSPLLSFLPLLCMPAMMTMLLLHSHPTSTLVTTIYLDRGSGTWKEEVHVYMIILYCTTQAEVLDVHV